MFFFNNHNLLHITPETTNMGGIPVFSCTTIFPMYTFHFYILLPNILEISVPSFQWKIS